MGRGIAAAVAGEEPRKANWNQSHSRRSDEESSERKEMGTQAPPETEGPFGHHLKPL